MGFRSDLRAAAMSLLEGYKAANDEALKQIYPGRPLSVFAPCAFVDSIDEGDITQTLAGTQRTPEVSIRLVQGNFDSADTVEGQDALVDGFIDYCASHFQEAGFNTISSIVSVRDEPGWVPEWMPDPQRAYYSTVVVLRGEGLFGGLV